VRTIGLLGGMSWESSAEYYRLLNELVRERLGGTHSARCVIWSADFAEIEALQEAGDWDAAGALLAGAARGLEGAGAELLLLGTNTMHRVAPQVRAAVGIPFLHLGEVTAAAVAAAGVGRAGLLGTAYTMSGPLYPEALGAHGIEVLAPEPGDAALVHRVIYDELVRGVVSDAARAAYREVIARLEARGADGVILGCTEIELLVGPGDARVPLFATTRLHCEAAVDAALAP
jgi:aspartate racemase